MKINYTNHHHHPPKKKKKKIKNASFQLSRPQISRVLRLQGVRVDCFRVCFFLFFGFGFWVLGLGLEVVCCLWLSRAFRGGLNQAGVKGSSFCRVLTGGEFKGGLGFRV